MTHVFVEAVAANAQELANLSTTDTGTELPKPVKVAGRFDFLHPLWHAAWADHLIPSKRWRAPAFVFRLTSGDSDAAEIVFANQAVSVAKILSLGGYYWPFRGASRNEALLSPGRFGSAMAGLLTQRAPGWALRLSPILDSDVAMQALSEQLRALGWYKFTRDSGKVFELDLPASEQALQATMSASLLRNVRYLRRRAEKEVGAMVWSRYSGPSLTAERMAEAAMVEEKSWVAAEQGDVKLLGAENRRFWQQVVQGEPSGSEVALWVLSVAGQPAAFSFHVETERTLCILANSYDPAFKQYSLGSILTYQVLCDAIERGRNLLDWGAGDSGYKQKWGAKGGSSLQEHLLLRPSLVGRLAALVLGRSGSGWTRVH